MNQLEFACKDYHSNVNYIIVVAFLEHSLSKQRFLSLKDAYSSGEKIFWSLWLAILCEETFVTFQELISNRVLSGLVLDGIITSIHDHWKFSLLEVVNGIKRYYFSHDANHNIDSHELQSGWRRLWQQLSYSWLLACSGSWLPVCKLIELQFFSWFAECMLGIFICCCFAWYDFFLGTRFWDSNDPLDLTL